ncbi:TrkH family potassium uptake protein [Salinicoccus roseus]|uniref:Ktr system potassium transporter B n=1 Tax=Salinicoccus roseus TaxID=45670 RepID=A0A0C2HE92_9STAP|nr:TrkH family potassium uptake protein [Salinicoccus roseus]KIH69954.1 Ktr system potassium transporter B [Salinicoccus roseus]MDB0581253.1 TrkH family potassium uptake protein [Salinicoccus roseus]
MKKLKQITFNPSQLLIVVFSVFIFLGTLLLKIPISTTESVSWVDALFTATSAMTVTGLVVVDTGTAYTLFGQMVILTLIQAGGLGIMSFAILIYMALGKKINFKRRMVIKQALNQTSVGGVIRLVKGLLVYSFTIEVIAMILLSFRWVPEYGWGDGMYYSLFHSVSAFNNAGFSIWADSLTSYVGDPVINIVITFLFITGGIGFTVLIDVWHKRKFKKLSLHSKLMISGTLIINLIAMFVFFILEFQNPYTLGALSSIKDQFFATYFQAVTPRTAGFNTVDIGSLNDSTATFMLLLMFIGAGSASTGGGIKLTSFLILVLCVLPLLQQKSRINIGARSIKAEVIFRALAISILSVLLIFSATFILTLTEKAPFIEIVFEVFSAFGTVGLSMGVTSDLSTLGKIVLVLVMFFGKLGPLNLAFSLAKPKPEKIKYPSEDILTG